MTWAMFCRSIQSSITNATALHNLVHSDKKLRTKGMALELARNYLFKNKKHEIAVVSSKRNCVNFKTCGARTQKICKTCQVYSCTSRIQTLHK